MVRPYLVYYDGKLAFTALTRGKALAEIGRLTLKGWKGVFELKEASLPCSNMREFDAL